MSVYLVTYDLNAPSQKHAKLFQKIKSYGICARLYESSYAISTSKTAQEVFDALKMLIDDNENLYVIPMRKPYVGFGPNNVIDWLDSHLPTCD